MAFQVFVRDFQHWHHDPGVGFVPTGNKKPYPNVEVQGSLRAGEGSFVRS